VQRIVLQRIESGVHPVLGQVQPELEDQRAFVAQHPLQTLRPCDGEFELGAVDTAMHPVLEHLAVPVAEEDPGMPLRRQPPPETPGQRTGQFFVARHIEAVDPNQPRVHPFVQQLDGLALARPLDAVDQDEHRKTRLRLEPILRLQQRLSQLWHRGVIGFLVDGVTDFG